MAQNDVFQVRSQFRDHGRVWTINTHYRDDTGVDGIDVCKDLVDAYAAAVGPALAACRAADSTHEANYASAIKPLVANAYELSLPSLPGGVTGTQSFPPNMNAVITRRTADPEATRYGRIYLGGLPNTWLDQGNWSSAALTALGALAAAMELTLAGVIGSYVPVVLRRYEGGIKLDPPKASDVSTCGASNIVYTQRRRNSRQCGHAA